MAGYSRIYVVGESGGVGGSDGVNHIAFQILRGEGNRQWLEVRYFDDIQRLGDIKIIIPEGPSSRNSLIDACIVFIPEQFSACPALSSVKTALIGAKTLDFTEPQSIPRDWSELREQARPYFRALKIWCADLRPLSSAEGVA
jgi:hypothetical protein